jgi:hypothetical protein
MTLSATGSLLRNDARIPTYKLQQGSDPTPEWTFRQKKPALVAAWELLDPSDFWYRGELAMPLRYLSATAQGSTGQGRLSLTTIPQSLVKEASLLSTAAHISRSCSKAAYQ